MRNKRRILFFGLPIALLVIFLLALGWLILRPLVPLEPVYEGKRLSVLLENYMNNGTNAAGWNQLNAAMQQEGTNAVPTLLRMLQAQDSTLRLKLLALAQKQHLVQINNVPAAELNRRAAAGFSWLGGKTGNAVPALMEIYERNISADSKSATAGVLGMAGPAAKAAVPALLRGTTSTNAEVRWTAVVALGQIHAEPAIVVPVLVKFLNNPDPSLRGTVAVALGRFGADARPAVPLLVEMLKDGKTRAAAADALKQIDPEAAAQAGIK